jgi:hypothetical protein
LKEFEQYVKRESKEDVNKRQEAKRSLSQKVTEHFKSKKKLKRSSVRQKAFERDLLLLLVKDLRPISFVDSPYVRQLILRLDPSVTIPSRREVREKLLPELRRWVNEEYVKPSLSKALGVCISFDLWMSRKTEDLFAVVAHYIDPESFDVCHSCIGLVKSTNTDASSLLEDLRHLLSQYNLEGKLVATVKDQGANLKACIQAMETVQSQTPVEVLPSLFRRFQLTCHAHLLSTALSKVFAKQDQGGSKTPIDHDLSEIDLFGLKRQLQSCTTYTKKSSKGRQLWEKAQVGDCESFMVSNI